MERINPDSRHVPTNRVQEGSHNKQMQSLTDLAPYSQIARSRLPISQPNTPRGDADHNYSLNSKERAPLNDISSRMQVHSERYPSPLRGRASV